MLRRPLLIVGLLFPQLLCGVFSAAVFSQDWPFLRGPGYDGHATKQHIELWTEKGPPVLWTRKLGQGYSAFVAAGNRVFTQGQHMSGQFVYCLDADSGATLWEYRYDWPYETAGVYPGPRSTPTLDGKRLYFTSPDGRLGCLTQETGRLLWSVDLQKVYGIEGCDFGYSCSPTVVDGLVILPVGGVKTNAGVVAFNATTGKEVWRSTSEPVSYTPAYPITIAGEPCVVCYMQNSLLILDRSDGNLRLKKSLSRGYDEHSAWPIYQEPYLWLSAPFRSGSTLLDVSKSGAGEIWRSELLSNDICSSVLVDGFLYGFDIVDVQSKTHRPSRGVFRCLNFETGEEQWSIGTDRPRRKSNADEFKNAIGQCGIVVVDDTLVILNELGELILLKADPRKPVEVARCSILSGELTWTPPCLHRGKLYARNQSRAVCVYLGDPAELAQAPVFHVADLPKRDYANVSAWLLPIEPEYAFDVPSNRWITEWFLAGAAIVAMGCLVVSPSATGWKRNLDIFVLMILGATGTTAIGHATGEFFFTWPVCLFASLLFAVRPPIEDSRQSRFRRFLRRRLGLAVLILVCLVYFLACRRLSLVFEWAFLFGLIGGVPITWFTRCWLHHPWRHLLASLAGLAAVYFTTGLFLNVRYWMS